MIKDGNISRKHAAVVRRNGAHYITDLGSTNGINYQGPSGPMERDAQGARITSRRIDEGSLFVICDYQLRFTYR